ncbi:MAG: hypothetical protein FWC26_12300 [Fibromonadales bacterium]|nr:hypothetical protein [Fibromonadales bacterium]
MRKSRKIFALATVVAALAVFIFLGCTSQSGPPICDIAEFCPESSSSEEPWIDPGEQEPGDSSHSTPSSQSTTPSSQSTTPSSQSTTPSSQSTTPSSNSVVPQPSSSSATVATPSSSSRPSSSSVAASNNCAYQASWCGGIAQADVKKESVNGNAPDGPVCIFATAISKLGNQNNGAILVNGKQLTGANNQNVDGRCGNTDWGQQTCAAALASVTKADGGYYIYVPGWAGDFSTTGGTPSCTGGGTTPSSNSVVASSSSRASSSSATVTTPSSSSQGSSGGGGTPCAQCNDNVTTGNAKTTRYWDSCKPSCAWTGNASGSPNGVAKACDINGNKQSGQVDMNKNACENGGNSYTCMDQVPWKVTDNLAYGFAASHKNADCGKCFLLQFKDNGEGGMSGTISGKKMVLMISNIGGDVSGDQFDIMIPGGGVGAFNALSNQISQLGGSSSDLGVQYGGFRGKCGNSVSCVQGMCNTAFSSSGLANLKAGCQWYIDWFGISNNPTAYVKEITCPSELVAKYK